MQIQKAAGLGWKVIEKILIMVATGLAAWVLMTVQALDKKVQQLEDKQEQDTAQWRLLQEQNRKMEELTVEQAVTKRVFEMLLHQNKIQINKITTTTKEDLSKIEELLKERKKDPERFRIQQTTIPNRFRPRAQEEEK